MDGDSFVPLIKGLPIVAKTPKTAYLSAKNSIRSSHEFRSCKVEEIPWEQVVGNLAMGVPKTSNHIHFFNKVIADLYRNGKIKAIEKKWTTGTGICEDETLIQPISFKKTISCFVCWLVGIILSLSMLIIELIKRRNTIALDSDFDTEVINELTVCITRIHQLKDTFLDYDVNEMIMEIGIAFNMEETCLEIIA